jgi:hypothetical protein
MRFGVPALLLTSLTAATALSEPLIASSAVPDTSALAVCMNLRRVELLNVSDCFSLFFVVIPLVHPNSLSFDVEFLVTFNMITPRDCRIFGG